VGTKQLLQKRKDMKTLLELRVYYEDTDFSGRVYHASYLRFLERGRTEWLRTVGFEHGSLFGGAGLIFAVRQLRIEYLAPALIDDMLRIETDLSRTQGAAIDFNQRILRSGREIAQAAVRVVSLKNDRPVRVPHEMIARIERYAVLRDAEVPNSRSVREST
jgi:acyl-CoA thioester hydrolase